MNIRPATPADIPAMRQLEAEAATAGHWSETQYQSVFHPQPRRLVLVIEEKQVLRGFLVGAAFGPEWEIENLAVAGAARRRGFGSALLGYFLDQVQEQAGTSVFLEVRESNAGARTLYEKSGFVESGRRRGYYSNPEEDAVIYRRSVPAPGLH